MNELDSAIGAELAVGFIPIEFRCSESDIASLQPPLEIFSYVSRYSYMNIVIEDVVSYFRTLSCFFVYFELLRIG